MLKSNTLILKKIKLYISLTRLNNPTGWVLLYIPCLWGISLALSTNSYKSTILYSSLFYGFLFLIGSIIMRSAGCIWNDLIDKDIDKKVKRTKNRPLAAKKVSKNEALLLLFSLLMLSFIIFLVLPYKAKLVSLFALIFACIYPFAKRFTNYPQVFLGLAFNTGVLISYTAITKNIDLSSIILYTSAILWTIGYDTIYGLQDTKEDIKIGVKSISVLFFNNIKKFILIIFALQMVFLFLLGLINNKDIFYWLFYLIISLIFTIQSFKINKYNKNKCFKQFKNHKKIGFLIFIMILLP